MEFSLTEQQIEAIYNKKIKPNLFDPIPVSHDKTSTFLGGQPGCGKSYLSEISCRELKESAIRIDIDVLRQYHPEFRSASKDQLYEIDKAFSYKIGELLIRDAIKEGKNILFDGTLGGKNIDFLANQFKRFQDAGYKNKINVIAVNDVYSKIGFSYRYHVQLNAGAKARHVDLSYHDEIYQNIPNNLERLAPLSDSISIFKRNHLSRQLERKEEFSGTDLKENPKKLVQSFIEERTRTFTPEEVQSIQSFFNSLMRYAVNNGEPEAEIRKGIFSSDQFVNTKLLNQIDQIIGLSEKDIKALNLVRHDIAESFAKMKATMEKMQNFSGEQLRRMGNDTLAALEKNIQSMKQRMEKIVENPSSPAPTQQIRSSQQIKQ
jgi:predicted ABC-type ATPase